MSIFHLHKSSLSRIQKISNILVIVAILNSLLGYTETREVKVCFKEHCFRVELAATSEEHKRGLMFRRHLDYNAGMLFVFRNEQPYGFWMKNTYLPLDIIWIDRNREVVFIKENVQPCTEKICPVIYPDKEALYVLEINAGLVRKIGLKVGDKLNFPQID